jgi:hypothetical protein
MRRHAKSFVVFTTTPQGPKIQHSNYHFRIKVDVINSRELSAPGFRHAESQKHKFLSSEIKVMLVPRQNVGEDEVAFSIQVS